MKKRNKFLTVIGSLVLVAALSFGVVACAGPNKKAQTKSAASKDVYALSAVAGANYLARLNEVAAPQGKEGGALAADVYAVTKTDVNESPVERSDVNERPVEYSDESVADIKNCLTMFDAVLESGISHTVEKNEEVDGDFADYNFIMTVTAGDFSAKVYFNELYTETKTEIDEEDGTEEFEESTYLSGVLLYGNEVFNVTGKREVENEDGENEYSIEFVTKKDDKNYVKVSYESETERNKAETSYEYEIVTDGKKVSETELSIETENGKTEIKFELENKSAEGKTEYKIVKKDDSDKFEIKAEFNGKKSYITVEAADGGYTFTYSNGYKETF